MEEFLREIAECLPAIGNCLDMVFLLVLKIIGYALILVAISKFLKK